jgi:UDP-2,3-diacylglucosamine pyrophosphatase LpxH
MVGQKLSAQVMEVKVPVERKGEVVSTLMISDIHIDNPACDRKLLAQHLNEAKARNARVFIFGDLFCAMQGKYDPRGSKAGIRPEHNVSNYLDALVDTTFDFLKPWADLIMFISPGNHETSILKRHETNLTERLAQLLKCQTGTYAGWLLMKFEHSKNHSHVVPIAYHHGYGGGGPVTKDIIQTSRRAVYLPDARVVVSGHTHDRWVFPLYRERINMASGQIKQDEQLHLKLGSYKDEYSGGEGWAIERGMPPKAMGGVWLDFQIKNNTINLKAHLT